MLEKTTAQQIASLDKKLIKVAAYDTPGLLMLALGLHGKFASEGEALHPLLNDSSIVNGMLLFGGIVVFLCAKEIFTILRQKKALMEQNQR